MDKREWWITLNHHPSAALIGTIRPQHIKRKACHSVPATFYNVRGYAATVCRGRNAVFTDSLLPQFKTVTLWLLVLAVRLGVLG
jgi:hypothetical protein